MPNVTLVETAACPVCGGTKREPSDSMSSGGFHYLKHAAAPLGISVEELIRRARVYRCSSCGSHFCDPWLSPELASSLFCAGSPDHNAGWAEFECWLRDLPGSTVRTQRLYAAVTRRTGPLRSYAEFGCPFQGFLMQFKRYETASGARVQLFARALRRPPDVRWSPLTRLYKALERVSAAVLVHALRLRSMLDALTGRRMAMRPPEPALALPERRYLLTQDSNRGWGSNCVRYGASCQYFAHAVLGGDVLPIEEARRPPAAAYDLVGLFNSLDHTSFPVDVLRTLLDMTNHVLVVAHSASHTGKQHLYAFGDDVAAWLGKSFEGLTVEDLRGEVDIEQHGGYNYLLLTRRTR